MALTDTRPVTEALAGSPRVTGVRRRRAADPRIARMLVVQAMIMAALGGLHTVLEGFLWWLLASLASFAVLGVATGVRARTRRAAWPSIAALLSAVGVLTLFMAPATAIIGFIPTPDTFAALVELGGAGIRSIGQQAAPAEPVAGIVMLVLLLVLLAAWFADVFLAADTPALVALPVGAIAAIPVVVRSGVADPLWLVAVALLYLVLLRIGRRADSRRIIGALAVVAVGGALVVPPLLPGVRDDMSGIADGGFRTGVNPLVSLGNDLRRGVTQRLLTYTTTSTMPVYLRMATMEDFTGTTWEPTIPAERGSELALFPDPPGLADDVGRGVETVDVEVGAFSSRWLPVPYPAVAVRDAGGDFSWLPDTLSVRSEQSSIRARSYSVDFLQVSPTGEQLVRGGAMEAPAETLSLPELPEIITTTATEVTSGARTPYERALALQSFLRAAPFRYSEQAPVQQGFDGTGIDAIATFLEARAGYCVHYASTMAVMARVVGIPSRLAVGFQPGAQVTVDGEARRVLTTDDLHAWPELYIEGVGWMRFEPTPGRGTLPDYDLPPVDDPETPEDESQPTATAAPAPTPTAAAPRPVDDAAAGPDPVAAAAADLGFMGPIGLGALAVLALPALWRRGIRWGRERRIRQGRGAAEAAWAEIRDTARDHGWSAPESETPRVFVERLVEAVDDPDGLLRGFRASVEASAYAQHPPGLGVDALRLARQTIADAAPWRVRIAAVLLPSSLLGRWRLDD